MQNADSAGAAAPAYSDEELGQIARLHVESIDDSLPALLGPRFAVAFYRFLDRSDRELLLTARVDGRIASACVVSLDPASLYGRLLRSLAPVVATSALRALARPEFRRFLMNFVRDRLRGAHGPDHAPEITFAFTDAQARGKRLGSGLVAQVDAALRSRGIDRYYVKTIDAPTNRAIAFYEREGFTAIGTKREGGRAFVEFVRELAAARPGDPSEA